MVLFIPWFLSCNNDLVEGTKISINSGTFLIIRVAHKVACEIKKDCYYTEITMYESTMYMMTFTVNLSSMFL
jgi:hypothetical protein